MLIFPVFTSNLQHRERNVTGWLRVVALRSIWKRQNNTDTDFLELQEDAKSFKRHSLVRHSVVDRRSYRHFRRAGILTFFDPIEKVQFFGYVCTIDCSISHVVCARFKIDASVTTTFLKVGVAAGKEFHFPRHLLFKDSLKKAVVNFLDLLLI